MGGICARRPRNSTIKLDFLKGDQYEAELYRDDDPDMRPTDVANGAMGPMTPRSSPSWRPCPPCPCQHSMTSTWSRWRSWILKKGDTPDHPSRAANGGYALYLTPKK